MTEETSSHNIRIVFVKNESKREHVRFLLFIFVT